MNDLSDWVKKVRAKTGMTQKKFGEAVGVAEGTVSDWEAGRRNPSKSAQMVIKVLEAGG